MKTKKEIVKDWITRYTGVNILNFGEYILLTNFQKYVDEFASLNNSKVLFKHIDYVFYHKVVKNFKNPKKLSLASIYDLSCPYTNSFYIFSSSSSNELPKSASQINNIIIKNGLLQVSHSY